MKKLFSILLTCTLVLSLVSVVSMAGADTQRSVPLLGVVVDGATETQEFPADGMGGVTLPGTGGWKSWVSYWTDEVADFAPASGEALYLVYDMTVPTGTNVQFTVSGWNNSIAKELAGAAAVLGEGGVYSIPAGTYSGALVLDRAQIGDNGRIGVLGNGIEIRTCALVCTDGTPKTPDPAPSKTTTAPTEAQPIEESSGVDLIDVITNGSDETDTTELADTGSGFNINQTKDWNVWVLNYTEEAADFEAASGEGLYLSYDFTLTGDGHLCLNGWSESVAAAIAKVAGAKTAAAEDSTPMLKAGTYQGAIPVTKEMIGENGRLGLRGAGGSGASAVIRSFRLVSGTVSEATGTEQVTTKATANTTAKSESQSSEKATTKASEPTVKKGDVNGDTNINMKDVLAVRKFIAGMESAIDTAAADVNSDGNVNMKDVLLLRKFIANMIDSFDEKESSTTTETTKSASVTSELNLINLITNGSDESDGTEIKDEGNGFVITQKNGWNVWVLYLNEDAPSFTAAAGEETYLDFDLTVNGDSYFTLNGWNNPVAAAIASACGAATTPAEDGTPMLVQGTYKGRISIDPSQIGETGRLGIVGTGATIRTLKLVTDKASGTTASTASTSKTTETVGPKTAPPTDANTPYFTYNTAETFGSLGVWWWNANTIISESNRTPRLDFLQQNHVTEIYLCVGSQSNEQLATFIKDAASRGMRVAWLSGDVSWIQSGSNGFDTVFNRFKTYQDQAAANEKFYGIHLDVEPHQAGSTQENWQLYANLVLRATKAAHDYGTVIEWDIPFWLDDMTVTVEGNSKKLLHVLAENSDTLTLMSYRDAASTILDVSKQEIPLGTEYNCKIILGVECYSEEGAFVSFMEDGKADMYNELQAVMTNLAGRTTLDAGYGCAIHYIETWMNLKN